MPEIARRAVAAVALHFRMKTRTDNRKQLANSVASELGVPTPSVKQWRRDAIGGKDARLTEQFRNNVQIVEENFPGDPAAAAAALVQLYKKALVS
jgi:hypothetical protein